MMALHFTITKQVTTLISRATILAEEKSYWRRLIIEGIEIKKLEPAHRANMQLGYEIDANWNPVLYPGKPGTPGLELES